MKSLAVAGFMVFMISFVHGIHVKGSTGLAILRTSQVIQSSQYETITGKTSTLSHANLVMTSNSLAQIMRGHNYRICTFPRSLQDRQMMFLQGATMTATPHVVTVTSPNSLHSVFSAVRKILRRHKYTIDTSSKRNLLL